MFTYDSSKVESTPSLSLIKPGVYAFEIVKAEEAVSKSGNPMVVVDLKVIDDEIEGGKNVRHWVVFIPPPNRAAGMSVHFRRCIGVPYEGKVEVEASSWVGKKLRAQCVVGEFNGKPKNSLLDILPYGKDFPEVEEIKEVSI